MPTISERNVVKIGNSHHVALPPGWLRWAMKKTGAKKPEDLRVTIIGDTVLTVKLKEDKSEQEGEGS